MVLMLGFMRTDTRVLLSFAWALLVLKMSHSATERLPILLPQMIVLSANNLQGAHLSRPAISTWLASRVGWFGKRLAPSWLESLLFHDFSIN